MYTFTKLHGVCVRVRVGPSNSSFTKSFARRAPCEMPSRSGADVVGYKAGMQAETESAVIAVECNATAHIPEYLLIGPIPWGHSGPLCHALSLSSSVSSLSMSWTTMRRRRATVPLATPGEWA